MKKIESRNAIKEEMLNQLRENGTDNKYYCDLVEDYMKMWDILNLMQKDVDKRGVTVHYDNGGGQSGYKKNDNVPLIPQYNRQMLSLLKELNLKPVGEVSDFEDI